MARTVAANRRKSTPFSPRKSGRTGAKGVKSEPQVKKENKVPIKQEHKVKTEYGSSVKQEESNHVKSEPMTTRSRKRAQDLSTVKPEKKLKTEVTEDKDTVEVPEKATVSHIKNQDARDRDRRKWEVVPAQEGRFILNPKTMFWVKVGSESYKTMLEDSSNLSYLEKTPVVKMDGRRWGAYGPPSSQAVRRKLPAQIFLIPEERKYPVATKARELPWSSGLRAAMARARLPISRNPKIYAKALDLMYTYYQDSNQSLPGVKNRENISSRKAKALSRWLSDRLAAHPHSRPEDMPPLEKVSF